MHFKINKEQTNRNRLKVSCIPKLTLKKFIILF